MGNICSHILCVATAWTSLAVRAHERSRNGQDHAITNGQENQFASCGHVLHAQSFQRRPLWLATSSLLESATSVGHSAPRTSAGHFSWPLAYREGRTMAGVDGQAAASVAVPPPAEQASPGPAGLADESAVAAPTAVHESPNAGQSAVNKDESDDESCEQDETQEAGIPMPPPAGSRRAAGLPGPADSLAIVAVPPKAGPPKREYRISRPVGGYEGQCWFECGTTAGLINIGTARSVKLCCGQCNNSRRAFDAQARMLGGEAKHVLADLKRNRQAEYKLKIRQSRLLGSQDRMGAGARREAANTFFTNITVTKGIGEVIPVYWMNKAEFIGHQITRLGHSRADAEATWVREIGNPRREKRGAGVDLRLAVCGIPKTEVRVGVDMVRSLSQSMEVDFSGRDGEARLAHIADSLAPAALPDLGTSEVFSAMDRSALAFGAASSSSGAHGANPLSQLALGSVGRTFCGDLARVPAALMPIAGDPDTPGRAARKLQGRASDADAPARAESKAEERKVARTPPRSSERV